MNPIYNEYLTFLRDTTNQPLKDLKEGYFWLDRSIIKGFDKQGNEHKFYRVKIENSLESVDCFKLKNYDNVSDVDLASWQDLIELQKEHLMQIETDSLNLIKEKMEKYNIPKIDFENIDIYRQLQKLNFFLDEPSLKAINLGKRLGFDVHDHVNQQEMPKIFKMYQELKDKEMLSKLIYHNYIDLQVLSYIYEYKESILNKILTINNKKFTGILKTIYIQKNYLITRLSNLKNIDINFHQSNYSITSNKDEIKISLELENGLIENNIKAKVFKSKYENKIFRESQNLTENFILITKNNKIIKENLLLLLNLI